MDGTRNRRVDSGKEYGNRKMTKFGLPLLGITRLLLRRNSFEINGDRSGDNGCTSVDWSYERGETAHRSQEMVQI